MSTITLIFTGMTAGAVIYGSYMWLTRKKPTPKVNTRLPAKFPITRVEPTLQEPVTPRSISGLSVSNKTTDAFGSTAVVRRPVKSIPEPVTRIPAPPAPPETRRVYARKIELEAFPTPDEVWSVARQRHEPVHVAPVVHHVVPDYYSAPAYSPSCSSSSSSSSYDSGSSSSSYSSSCDSSSSSSDSGSCGGGCD